MKANLKSIFGGDFGKIDSDKIAMTMNGLGFKGKSGSYSVYDKATKSITTVPEDFILGEFPIFSFPAQTDVLKEGDLVMHNGYLKVFLGKNEDGTLKTINVTTQEIQTLVPTKNVFGFGVFAKVFSPFDGVFGAPADAAPGAALAFNPLMLMLMSNDDEDGDGGMFGDMDPMMLMMMSGGMPGMGGGVGGMNPMMVMAMSGMLGGKKKASRRVRD